VRRIVLALGLIGIAASFGPAQQAPSASPVVSGQKAASLDYDRLRVGPLGADRIVVPTNQVLSPLGRQVVIGGRPTDLALSPDGRWLAVLSNEEVLLIDPVSAKIVSHAPHKEGSFTGIRFTPDGKRLVASSFKGRLGLFDVTDRGKLQPKPPLKLARAAGDAKHVLAPAGLVIDPGGATCWVVLNTDNLLAHVDLETGRILREIQVGNAPYAVILTQGKAYVSNWAGRLPGKDDVVGPSGEAPAVRVDPKRYIASDGSVSVVDLQAGREVTQIVVGLHPSGLALTPDGRYLCVANANSDTVSVIDTNNDTVVETISTRPAEKLLFGSAPNALVASADGKTLYVSNGTNNAVALVELAPGHSRVLGCLPTGWYPAGLVADDPRGALYVANIKGIGSRSGEMCKRHQVKGQTVFGYNTHDHQGTISLIPLPPLDQLAGLTQTVLENNRLTQSVSALAPPRPEAPPRPVPHRHGERSVFKHVLYIIKENRTYDQVFGDMPRGEGDPKLCMFGREVTPNHHKLADEFVLLDNFYCSGVLSADGHQWTNEAYVTDYLEKSFGGFPRSYPYDGNDAMAYASSGFLWDNALEHGRTLRVYGEFASPTVRWKDPERKERPTFTDCYRDFVQGSGKIEIRGTAAIQSLQPYLCPESVCFPLIVTDAYRAAQFLREFRAFERKGELPNLIILSLPSDHTSGTKPHLPTPEASVADNDLALGQIVEAVSRSRFWPETCIFVVEDDPQAGFDHIDGHRTVALVISPYTRRRVVDSTNYNQTSMVRTIELILGLPPMNQFDASATAMSSCFTDTPDTSACQALKNNIPLDQLNPSIAEIRDPRQRHWAEVSDRLPLEQVDQADEDTFNRILWYAARGSDETYPAWAVNHDDRDRAGELD
jgi:YVTN family beta-propeller protein